MAERLIEEAYRELNDLESAVRPLEKIAHLGDEFKQAHLAVENRLAEIILSPETYAIVTADRKSDHHVAVYDQAISEITMDVFGCPYSDSKAATASIAWLADAIEAAQSGL